MGMEKIKYLIEEYSKNPNERDQLVLISAILGLSSGELSCCRGMLAELSENKAEYIEIMENLLKKRSENTIRNDRKRYQLYLCVSETGKE